MDDETEKQLAHIEEEIAEQLARDRRGSQDQISDLEFNVAELEEQRDRCLGIEEEGTTP